MGISTTCFGHVTRMSQKRSERRVLLLHPQQSGSEVDHGLGGLTRSQILLVSRFGVETAELSEGTENCAIFLGLLELQPP